MKAKSKSDCSDEGAREEEAAVVCWCDLPPELLAMIAAGSTPTDIIVFRSVCRSWRWSIPPPFPNKHILSPIFPLTISFHDRRQATVTANTVYLVQSSKVWMLSAQEYIPGKFLLQHPLTYQTIPGSNVLLDLSESKVTQIHTSCTFKGHDPCDPYFQRQHKVVLVPNPTTPIALCRYIRPSKNYLYAFPTTTEEEGNIVDASQVPPFFHRIEDFVSFNGWIYLVELVNHDSVDSYDILMLDYKTGEKFGTVCDSLAASCLTMARPSAVHFVVSNCDLFLVFESYIYHLVDVESDKYDRVYECRVYRLVWDDLNVPTCCKLERVDDLGDRVFFVNADCSFSASARDLPRPWKGNCVVFTYIDTQVFDLGTGQWKRWPQTKIEGYLDLFSPPAGLLAKKSRKKKIKKKKLELIDGRS